jgi:hypothetical protein
MVKAFTTFLDHFIHVDIPLKIVSYMQSQNLCILDNIQCNVIDGNWLKVVNIRSKTNWFLISLHFVSFNWSLSDEMLFAKMSIWLILRVPCLIFPNYFTDSGIVYEFPHFILQLKVIDHNQE